jgi:cytochrome P450
MTAFREDTVRNTRLAPPGHAAAGVNLQHRDGLLLRDAASNVRPVLNPLWERKVAESMRPRIGQLALVSATIARDTRNPDLAAAFAAPYVLGVSMLAAGLTLFEAKALTTFSDMTTGALLEKPAHHVTAGQAWDSLYALAGPLVRKSRLTPDQSLLGHSVAALDEAGMTEDEVLDTVTTIYNGLPTARPVLTRALEVILARPGVLDACADSPQIIPAVVAEALRFAAHFTFGLPGMVTRGAKLSSGPVHPGTVILPVIRAAHLDPARTRDPDVFDPARQRRGHLAWGAGQHTCLGRHLATVLLEEGVAAMALARPKLACHPLDLEYWPGTMAVPLALPVKW